MQRINAVLYDQNAEPPIKYAAGELIRCLQAAYGAVMSGSAQDKVYPVRLQTGISGLSHGAFRWTVNEQGVLLESGTPSGIVYGAYALLEAMGFRFLARDCEVIPDPLAVLPFGIHEEAPAFAVRELFWREVMDGDFAVKLRLNSARSTITPEQGGKAMFYNFSHTFHQLVSEEKYFDTHPEYFSMVDGKRIRERTQLCLTNPDVMRLCVKGVKKWARENPDYNIFSVAMNDWYQPCQCPACAKADAEEESHAGTMIRFVNAVAEEAEKEFPGIMIHTFAYLYCRKPPKKVRPRHNVIVRLCSIECCFAHPIDACGCELGRIDVQGGFSMAFHGHRENESSFLRDLKGWSRICENLYIWDYTTNYANYLLPFPNLNVLQDNLRLFRRFGVKGVFEQGNFSHGRSSALGALKIYLLGKLLWDPDADAETLIQEFCTGYYGPAKTPMQRYVALWQNACAEEHAGIYDAPDAPYLTDERLEQAAGLLREAQELAVDTPYKERVEREELSVRYATLTRMPLDTPGRDAMIDQFSKDAKRLGISELFERRDFDGSAAVMKASRYCMDRFLAASISYPI